jgi:hypothetical protein
MQKSMENLLVTGMVLSMDKYGRARLLINDSYEINKIITHIKQNNNYIKFPFEHGKFDYNELVLIVTLKKHKKHWASKMEQNRCKIITIETKPRIWNMDGATGISLDLVNIEEV